MIEFLRKTFNKLTADESSPESETHAPVTMPPVPTPQVAPSSQPQMVPRPKCAPHIPSLSESVPSAPWDWDLLTPIQQTFGSHSLYWVYKATTNPREKAQFEKYFEKYPQYYEEMKAIDERLHPKANKTKGWRKGPQSGIG